MNSHWHGWKKNGFASSLHIGVVPGRKQVCVYMQNGSSLEIMGYFRNRVAARAVLDFIDFLVDMKMANTIRAKVGPELEKKVVELECSS